MSHPSNIVTFLTYSQHANDAQQAFSSDMYPTVAMGIPALEHLHKKWSRLVDLPKYAVYSTALQAGLDKVNEYYIMTENSDAFIMCMGMYHLSSSLRTSLNLSSS